MSIKAIETVYNGYRFRSRLEARWAVFFDTLDIRYEYEPQGFLIGLRYEDEGTPDKRRPYLPDFHLPELESWAEVKGGPGMFDYQLLADAVDWGAGLPGMSDTQGEDRGLLLLGPIPLVQGCLLPLHPLLQHSKGGRLGNAYFVPRGIRCINPGIAYFDSSWGEQDKEDWVDVCEKMLVGQLYARVGATMAERVERAYLAARQARFEHGATPRVPR